MRLVERTQNGQINVHSSHRRTTYGFLEIFMCWRNMMEPLALPHYAMENRAPILVDPLRNRSEDHR